jgi:hypothetical protein
MISGYKKMNRTSQVTRKLAGRTAKRILAPAE